MARVVSSVNEAFDLMVYNTAAWLRLKADLIDWANPPAWAIPLPDAWKI
jgi:phage terminase large subunit GpA-like protein